MLDVMFNGFDNNDGVVDHKADGEDEAKQRERIDRKAEHRKNGESTDERNGHGKQRDEGGAPVLEEQKDDDDDEDDGLKERGKDFFHAFGNGQRSVHRDRVVQATGESRFQIFHLRFDLFCDS